MKIRQVFVILICVALFPIPDAMGYPDAFEPDDAFGQARIHVLNAVAPSRRTFHRPEDEDWVKFYGIEGEAYTVRTQNPSASCDTVIELYDVDGENRLAEVDNNGEGEGESLDWSCPARGVYFVRLYPYSPPDEGESMEYDLAVFRPHTCLVGTVAGTVVDSNTGGALEGVRVEADGHGSALSEEDGSYALVACSESTSIEFFLPGYQPLVSEITVVVQQVATKNISLVPEEDSEPPTGEISIQAGAESTAVVDVELYVDAQDPGSGVSAMRFSNDGAVWCPWMDFAPNAPWRLSPGEGEKTVYAQFEDGSGNRVETLEIFDRIVYGTKAVVATGGDPSWEEQPDPAWEHAKNCAEFAFRVLQHQGYSKEDIFYLSNGYSDADGDGENDVDFEASEASLNDVITDEVGETDRLLLYFVGPGGPGFFVLNPQQNLQARNLLSLLNMRQASISEIVFVCDAPWSGSFVQNMPPPEGKTRIVAAGASRENALFLMEGKHSFSYGFWASVMLGNHIGESFVQGEDMVAAFQSPLLDADGDGAGSESQDFALADQFVVGRGCSLGPPVSEISTCSAKPFFAGSFSVKIQAGPITHADQVDEVWAVVVSPCHGIGGGDEAMEHIMSIGLTDGDQDGVFEATEDRFAWKGEYDISVYATDLEERLLASIQTDFLCEQGEFCSQCDVNGDGRSDLTDVSLILKTLAGNLPSGALPQGLPLSGSDLNGDGRIGLEESAWGLRNAAMIER